MKQVLLATNGEAPSQKAFFYAVELSQRVRARLSILCFIEKERLEAHLVKTRKKAAGMSRFLEDSFADAGLAQGGLFLDADQVRCGACSPLKEMLKGHITGVDLEVTVSGGDPETDIEPFVESHRNVILTILDSSKKEDSPGKKKALINLLKKKLGVPVVVVKPGPV